MSTWASSSPHYVVPPYLLVEPQRLPPPLLHHTLMQPQPLPQLLMVHCATLPHPGVGAGSLSQRREEEPSNRKSSWARVWGLQLNPSGLHVAWGLPVRLPCSRSSLPSSCPLSLLCHLSVHQYLIQSSFDCLYYTPSILAKYRPGNQGSFFPIHPKCLACAFSRSIFNSCI